MHHQLRMSTRTHQHRRKRAGRQGSKGSHCRPKLRPHLPKDEIGTTHINSSHNQRYEWTVSGENARRLRRMSQHRQHPDTSTGPKLYGATPATETRHMDLTTTHGALSPKGIPTPLRHRCDAHVRVRRGKRNGGPLPIKLCVI